MNRALRRQRVRVAGGAPPVDPPPSTAPTIDGFSPSSGPLGTVVTLLGTNFVIGATVVRMGGVIQDTINVASSGMITFPVDADSLTGLIRVETAAGFAVSTGAFTIGATVHYGNAQLPRVTPTAVRSNANGSSGVVHNPGTPAALRTLLTGAVLAAGDTIVLNRGTCYNDATHTVHVLPPVAGAETNPIVIRTSGLASIPAPGTRINETHRAAVPHFRAIGNNQEPLWIRHGAHGYRLVGIEIDCGTVSTIYGILRIGPIGQGSWRSDITFQQNNITNGGWISLQNGNLNNPQVDGSAWWRRVVVDDLPRNITLDRCDIAARSHANNCVIVVYVAAATHVIVDCHLWTEGGAGLEDKAYLAVTATGPALIENNTMVASAINMLVGGEDPSIANVVPQDYTIRRNWFYTPLRMIAVHPSWDGLNRWHKNKYENKVGKYFLLEDNVFENHFDGIQSQYYGIVLKTAFFSPGFTAATTSDITFRYNVLKNLNGLFGFGPRDQPAGGGPYANESRFSIYHNYTSTPGGSLSPNNTRAWMIQLGTSYDDIHFEHNTFIGDPRVDIRTLWYLGNSNVPLGLKWRNMVADYGGQYGGFTREGFGKLGEEVFEGAGSFIDSTILYNNPVQFVPASKYPGSKVTIITDPAQLFVNRAAGNYRTIPALAGTGFGGRTPGCDIDAVNERTAGCITGVWS